MKKIGIYGESYTVPTYANTPEISKDSWINRLGYATVTHGFHATSILWSYWKFLEHHKKYDQNVFIISDPTRADHFGPPDNNFISSLQVAENLATQPFLTSFTGFRKSAFSDLSVRAKAFREYYLHIQNDLVDETYASLILNDILRRRPDTILIPINPNSPKFFDSPVSSLRDYISLQFRSLFPDNHAIENVFGRYTEIKTSNHLTEETNQLLADYVKRALDGEGWQDWKIYDIPSIPHNKSWDYYYTFR